MNSSGVVTTSSTCDTTRLTYISTLNGDVQSQINDIKSGATSVGNSAKATSATSATYSSTANYAKTAAGATTASKATSATSATYSSTANYAKSAPTYKGATTAAAGTKGLVPAASTATKNCFLRGDGQWADPVSTGTDGTIRYDQSDDWIKVYFNGSWSNWKKAGLLWDFYLYKDGNPYYDYTGGYYLSYESGTGDYTVAENSNSRLKFTRSGSFADPRQGIMSTRQMINLSSFSKIRVIGSATGTNTNSYNFTIGLGICTVNTNVLSIIHISEVQSNVQSTKTFDIYLDISAYNGEYYFVAYQPNYNITVPGGSAQASADRWCGYIEISSIQLIS